jgi:hypothetical protein
MFSSTFYVIGVKQLQLRAADNEKIAKNWFNMKETRQTLKVFHF